MRSSIASFVFPAALVVAALLLLAPQVRAQQCPGLITVAGPAVLVTSQGNTPTGGPLCSLIGGVPTCGAVPTITGMAFGTSPPTLCGAAVFAGGGMFTAQITAAWANTASNTTMNRCTFMLLGGNCAVRGGDGLPVELMEFSIESDADSDTEEVEPDPDA